jgi:hypothetical protein
MNLKKTIACALFPPIRRLVERLEKQEAVIAHMRSQSAAYSTLEGWVATRPEVLRYRMLHYELTGHTAPDPGVPVAYFWPDKNENLS